MKGIMNAEMLLEYRKGLVKKLAAVDVIGAAEFATWNVRVGGQEDAPAPINGEEREGGGTGREKRGAEKVRAARANGSRTGEKGEKAKQLGSGSLGGSKEGGLAATVRMLIGRLKGGAEFSSEEMSNAVRQLGTVDEKKLPGLSVALIYLRERGLIERLNPGVKPARYRKVGNWTKDEARGRYGRGGGKSAKEKDYEELRRTVAVPRDVGGAEG